MFVALKSAHYFGPVLDPPLCTLLSQLLKRCSSVGKVAGPSVRSIRHVGKALLRCKFVVYCYTIVQVRVYSMNREVRRKAASLRVNTKRKVSPPPNVFRTRNATSAAALLANGNVGVAQVFIDPWKRPLHLYPNVLEDPVKEEELSRYAPKLNDLFSRPDEVWRDSDTAHGPYLRFLKFHFDHMLVGLVDMRDHLHIRVLGWYPLEYDLLPALRPGGRQAGSQRQGVLVHSRCGGVHEQV